MDYTDFFDKEIILEDDRARLEPLTPRHYDALMAIALSNPDIWKFTMANITDEQSFSHYFNTALKEKENKTSYPFAMFDKRENRCVGCTRYANISFRDKRLEIGWTWIDPLLQGSGINKHNKFLMLQYCFEKLGLIRVFFKTDSNNKRSQRAMEKIGAKYEGTLRNHMIREDGTFRHSVYYSIIESEWEEVKSILSEQSERRIS